MPLPAVREGLHDKELSPLPNYTNDNNIIIIYYCQLFGKDYTAENFHPDPIPRWRDKDNDQTQK